ncbi:MAG TPA: WecB/TagA/CpsF family glycosyltransferase [Nevskia sp.]|nr:WecB/TagA/CpsF family glycosyltransferase [Nevskia sp.]
MGSIARSESSLPTLCCVDGYDVDAFTRVAAEFGQRRYGFVVTPNADHLIRLAEDEQFRRCYAAAAYTLLDSRVVAKLLDLGRGQRIPVCPGSELVESLFERVIRPDDGLVLIGGSAEQAEALRRRYGLKRLAHHNPPMGFAADPEAVEACLRFVEAHSPFRYCLLAVGSPRQEMLAQRLAQRGRARGLALCVGASIDFLTGRERRAPAWMRRLCLEWLFRLLQSPTRLAQRYLVRCPRVFTLLRRHEIALRLPALPPARRETITAKAA